MIGSRIEPNLIHGMADVSPDSVDECVTAGMLRFDAPTYAFRHELVRQSVLSGITPGRLGALHWQVLDRLRALPMAPRPFARLAEHAEMAGDGPAILEFAVAAGDSAASLGSHREAAYQYGRAMPYAELLEVDDRIALLVKRAEESAVSDDHESAIAAWDQALVLLRAAGRTLEVVDALLGLDESYYTIGDNSHGGDFVDEALELLDGLPPSRQLAMTLQRRGSHYLRASETSQAMPWIERALRDRPRGRGLRSRLSREHQPGARPLPARGPRAGYRPSGGRAAHRARARPRRTPPHGSIRPQRGCPGWTSTWPRDTRRWRRPRATRRIGTSTVT